MLVVDLLPAGFEIESVAVGKGVNKEELVTYYLNYQIVFINLIMMIDLLAL